jgi:AcrR family transcriptional regulator
MKQSDVVQARVRSGNIAAIVKTRQTSTVVPRRKKTRSGPKGKGTRARIIGIARSILVDEGYESFVLRQIAARAGIRPGNLQYYFASKKELLQAVLEPELARYNETYAAVTAQREGQEEAIGAVIDFLLTEIKLKATCNIWYTVWALAPQDADIGTLMDDWYLQYMRELKRVIKFASPKLSDRNAGHVASLLTAIMDGLTMQIGYGKAPREIHSGIEGAVKSLFLALTE